MSGITLPFDDSPIVAQYLNNTYILGIIQANAEKRGQDITPWLCSKFINCSFFKGYRPDNNNTRFSVQVFDGSATNDSKLKCVPIYVEREQFNLNEGGFIFELLNLFSHISAG